MQKMNKKAFTLVELIVVIIILAILWTIAFISLQWYSKNARDSVRITDLSNISKQLELMLIKAWIVYIPENKVDITASWTVISYQWEMWLDTLNKLRVNNWWLDPVDQTPYIYSTTKNLKQYELMWFLENWNNLASIISQSYAATNLINRFPVVKWESIWIILNPTTNSPINLTWVWVDIVNTNTAYKVYLDNSTSWSVIGTWIELPMFLSKWYNFKTCKHIINLYWKWIKDWTYTINPTWKKSFDVYCDMTTDWWGWTRVVNYTGDSLNANLINASDWYQDSNNYSYLYTFKDIKKSTWEYEFLVRWYGWSISRWLQFTQTNSYDENPNNNSFNKIAWNFIFSYNSTKWKGLALWKYWNINMQWVCPLAMSYWSNTITDRWTCLIDKELWNWWTWPWTPSLWSDRVIILQR